MRKIINYIVAFGACLLFTQCNSYLNTSSAGNTDDDFVTSTPSETFKTLSWCYANYRQNCAVTNLYDWNDPVGSDAEMYPEANSSNNLNAILQPSKLTVDVVAGGFNGLYTTLARASKVANIIAGKAQYQADAASGKATDWTQLYGEAITIRAFCYFELTKHFGDVPYGYENNYASGYTLSSRFDIYDKLIADLEKVEPLMYKIGDDGMTAQRFTRTFADALIGEIAYYSAGYQTIRTDVSGLYGNVQFTNKSSVENNCVYARRNDYLDYEKVAEKYLQAAIDNEGTCHLLTSVDDAREYVNNPFQMHFQYMENLQVSPESLFEIGNIQGGQTGQSTTSEYPYAFGRPSAGGTANAAPCKSFGGLRVIPTVYYGDFQNGDKRRDVSVTVTGSNGDGNEAMLSFVPGSKLTGGIACNKWDENRMNPPYTAASRQSGIDYPVLRMADVMLRLAQVKADLGGEDQAAMDLVNKVRERAFGDTNHDISGLSGQALKDAILNERKLELLGESKRRWDLILSGEFDDKASEVKSGMQSMISDLQSKGYHTFVNGNVISNYIWIKMDNLGTSSLTYDCTNTSNPDLFPGWRGQYYWSSLSAVSNKVKGTNHNVAIMGLFNYIDPNSQAAANLVAQGYKKTNWGIDIVNNSSTIMNNILSGISSENDPPRYYWPIPYETLSQSGGKVTNGYGLPQQ